MATDAQAANKGLNRGKEAFTDARGQKHKQTNTHRLEEDRKQTLGLLVAAACVTEAEVPNGLSSNLLGLIIFC